MRAREATLARAAYFIGEFRPIFLTITSKVSGATVVDSASSGSTGRGQPFIQSRSLRGCPKRRQKGMRRQRRLPSSRRGPTARRRTETEPKLLPKSGVAPRTSACCGAPGGGVQRVTIGVHKDVITKFMRLSQSLGFRIVTSERYKSNPDVPHLTARVAPVPKAGVGRDARGACPNLAAISATPRIRRRGPQPVWRGRSPAESRSRRVRQKRFH